MATVDADFALGPSEDFLNKAIRIGLYLSATFQVICLTTIIFLPSSFMKCFNGWDVKNRKLDESDDTSSEHSTPQNDPKQRHHQRRKQEKKKRK
ncbi:protein anon-73B1-like [Lutzomyia longipalpis]|uniref:protein anon-73B1-like n=1 Tax=Lutzomyia longipalpis TaxID=7200 RepID=UPI0024840E2F|nr:protein anon-73B1-like [Lutzomyia longipalpis]XP_055692128.1 protein anon-73B1-like [Lutzomyia longipalpis]